MFSEIETLQIPRKLDRYVICLCLKYSQTQRTIIIITIQGTMLMVLASHFESTSSSFDECRTSPSGCRPSDQANQLGLWVRLYAAIVYIHHHHLLLITQPESWYLFYFAYWKEINDYRRINRHEFESHLTQMCINLNKFKTKQILRTGSKNFQRLNMINKRLEI